MSGWESEVEVEVEVPKKSFSGIRNPLTHVCGTHTVWVRYKVSSIKKLGFIHLLDLSNPCVFARAEFFVTSHFHVYFVLICLSIKIPTSMTVL